MIPVIVIPIVLTTKTVTVTLQTFTITSCGSIRSSACDNQADANQGNGGVMINLTFKVNNVNYRPGSSSFDVKVVGVNRTISPLNGFPTLSNDFVAKGDTTMTVGDIPLLYNEKPTNGVTIIRDEFFTNVIYDPANPTDSTVKATPIHISGSMRSQVGKISTQNINFNFACTISGLTNNCVPPAT
jgi:hypothetical protein